MTFFEDKENKNQNALSIQEVEKLKKIMNKINQVSFIKDLENSQDSYPDKIIKVGIKKNVSFYKKVSDISSEFADLLLQFKQKFLKVYNCFQDSKGFFPDFNADDLILLALQFFLPVKSVKVMIRNTGFKIWGFADLKKPRFDVKNLFLAIEEDHESIQQVP